MKEGKEEIQRMCKGTDLGKEMGLLFIRGWKKEKRIDDCIKGIESVKEEGTGGKWLLSQ